MSSLAIPALDPALDPALGPTLGPTLDPALEPAPTPVGARLAYYYLVNADEHPEVLPLALDVVRERLAAVDAGAEASPARLAEHRDGEEALARARARLGRLSAAAPRPWAHAEAPVARRRVLHFLAQLAPTALVDGCWLQGALRVGTAHTDVGARLTAIYARHVRALVDDPERHFVREFRDLYGRLASPLEDVASRALAERREILDASFDLPLLLLALGQFPRRFLPEIVGLHVAWEALGVPAFARRLLADARGCHALPASDGEADPEDGVEGALDVARRVAGDAGPGGAWARVLAGVALGEDAWTRWLAAARHSAPDAPADPRQEMLELVGRKAPHAVGYHADRRIGRVRIDDHLRAAQVDPAAFLDALAASRYVKPGDPERSHLLRGLVAFGGPMLAVFSRAELDTIRRWIASLPADGGEGGRERGGAPAREPGCLTPPAPAPAPAAPAPEPLRPVWTRAAFQRRGAQLHGDCSVRELYHRLVNVELHPDALPVAERFAADRMERSMAMLVKGERPIPCDRYDPAALERWVLARHREQVDSYRPLVGAPRVSRRQFCESTVQLAPLLLIDGGWLQGVASPPLIHTVVGRLLFHVLYEEIGEGNAAEHHANVYRDLLAAMGEAAPPVESRAFAEWPRLRDASFDVPTLWLSLSLFPRHFLPEILGLNLAVELAGVGGPYLEARDTLRYYGLPTLFVDVHNAADNVSVGHSAWALQAIKTYLDDVAAREGPHGVDHDWHRVWSGVRATLPQIGRARLALHRVVARLVGSPEGRRVPRIFRT